jgi:hypothetical protein
MWAGQCKWLGVTRTDSTPTTTASVANEVRPPREVMDGDSAGATRTLSPDNVTQSGVRRPDAGRANTCSPIVEAVPELPTPELVENRRRSVAMLPPGAPALNRDEALEVLQQLVDALSEIRDLRRVEGPST